MIKSEDVFHEKDELNKMMNPFDRVRGVMYYGKMDDFIDDIKLAQYQSFASHKGRVLVYGVGASYIHKGDTLIYCDLARWEIQLRYRKGMPNFKQDNDDEDVLKKIKRSFFIEWRIADKHKMDIFENIDYFLDSNQEGNPKIVTGNALRSALKKTTQRPFRLVPYFASRSLGWTMDAKRIVTLMKNKITMLGVLMVFQKKIVFILDLEIHV